MVNKKKDATLIRWDRIKKSIYD